MGREQHAASHTEEVSYFPSQNENKAGRGKIKDRIQKRGKEGILGGGGAGHFKLKFYTVSRLLALWPMSRKRKNMIT